MGPGLVVFFIGSITTTTILLLLQSIKGNSISFHACILDFCHTKNNKMQILIVDSSMQVMNRLEEMLSESGKMYTILKAVSSEAAGKLFKEINPEVVVMDIGLHGDNSCHLITEIKKVSPSTVVIVLSIHMDEQMQEQCKSIGVDFFLDKYNEFGQIPAIIDQMENKKKGRKMKRKLTSK